MTKFDLIGLSSVNILSTILDISNLLPKKINIFFIIEHNRKNDLYKKIKKQNNS